MTTPGPASVEQDTSRDTSLAQNNGGVQEHQSIVQKLWSMATSRYMLSVGAQAGVSGFHFAVNLILIRILSLYDYGIFAYAFVLAMFAAAINNALISTPLTVYTPVIKNTDERAELEALFSTLNLILFFILMFAGVAYIFISDTPADTVVGVTLFVAVYSARQFSRSFGYAKLKPLVTATGDISYVVTGAIIIGGLLFITDYQITVAHALIALALANLVAMFIERWRLHGLNHHWFTLSKLGGYTAIWAQSRWALVGALTTLFLAQAHGLIITWFDGPNSFAPLAAGMVLFGPVRVALLTWQNMVKPELAIALSEQRFDAVRTQIRKTCVLMAIAVVLLGVALYFAWPYIHNLLYANKYADQPMGIIVLMWAIITFFAAIYNAPSAALQAMKDFRILAMASVYGAAISGVLVSVLLFSVSPESTLLGIMAAECFMAFYLIRIMLRHLKRGSQIVAEDATGTDPLTLQKVES